MWPQEHRSGNVTWKVLVGKKNDGKADLRSFETEEQAKVFLTDWNAKLATGNTNGLADLSTLARAEILAAIAKLEAFNATLPEAVDFFLKYAKPEKGTISIEDAVKAFLTKKAELKRSEAYQRNCKRTFYQPFARAFAGRVVSEISQGEAEKYINSHRKWSSSSKASHINYLRTFYEFFIKRGYAKLNPFKNIEQPYALSSRPKVLMPEQVQKLLQFALDNECKGECASMVLVFFCGVRVQEAGRLTWENIDLHNRKVEMKAEIAKAHRRRVNDIPDNAWEWLSLCKSTGRVSPNDYNQRMKRLRAKSGIEYPQNAMRHCFASYHLSQSRNAATTAVLLGHPNPTLLYQTYYELVKAQDTKVFWSIIPACIQAARDAQRKKDAEAQDNQERVAAECNSNIGEAVKLDGQWIAVQKE